MHVNTSFSDYQAHVGSTFLLLGLAAGAPPGALTLTAATLTRDDPVQVSFSLLFAGPPPVLRQGTYALRHAVLGELHLFLVPVRQTAGGFVYEAAFSLLKARETA
jgi:energy-converting hydrogenase Eha subunit A